MAELLMIGQLATHCGVTVRAVRHYHRIGLLPEPTRDRSGYRRYDAKAVVNLIRIRVLAEAGVPLTRVGQLLDATAADFAAEVARIDDSLQNQVIEIEHRRRQLAGLLAGDRLVLPAEVAELLDELRAMGTSEQGVGIERDAWILMEAVCPEVVPEWARQKRAALAEEEARRLYLACDQARDLNPADPWLEKLADQMVDWAARHARNGTDSGVRSEREQSSIVLVGQLMDAEFAASSPAWRRLGELSKLRRPSTEQGDAKTKRSDGPASGGQSGFAPQNKERLS